MIQVAQVSLDPAKKKTQVTEVKSKSKPTTSSQSAGTTTQKIPVKRGEPAKKELPPAQNEETKRVSTKVMTFVRSSKFRHIEGRMSHPSSTIDKVPSLSTTVPGDSNAFHVNKERVAVVLSVAGGQVAVIEVISYMCIKLHKQVPDPCSVVCVLIVLLQ